MPTVESRVHGGSDEPTRYDDTVASARAAVERAFFAAIVGTTVDKVGTAPHGPSAEQRANGEPVTIVSTAPNTPEERLGVPKLVAVMQEVGPDICCAREATTTNNPNAEFALAA
ncbi:MAG TPA: hypothetical protein PKA29_02050 [Candidatus Saccharibacteria bacterium]|nr:hypothetical protein [Candidatus Saccharibacteria bacterium]